MDAQWWRLSALDSAIVSTTDGTSTSWYRRDRVRFAQLMKRSLVLHERLLVEWPALAERYQSAADELVAPATWARTFSDLEAGQGSP
jgi:galactofuranosylgalactofuranosylrhamnosyl-N-acetylglucosaminyl-diphospho-decaprenol beta-1,5/1,6-galactofuranosyltransferase